MSQGKGPLNRPRVHKRKLADPECHCKLYLIRTLITIGAPLEEHCPKLSRKKKNAPFLTFCLSRQVITYICFCSQLLQLPTTSPSRVQPPTNDSTALKRCGMLWPPTYSKTLTYSQLDMTERVKGKVHITFLLQMSYPPSL